MVGRPKLEKEINKKQNFVTFELNLQKADYKINDLNQKNKFRYCHCIYKNMPYICINNTSHASHLNSAPGLVFDFYWVNLISTTL